MKLIQIFALAVALAVTAMAQTTNSTPQNTGSTAKPKTSDTQKPKPAAGNGSKSSADTSKIQVTVPKDTKTATKAGTPATQKPAAAQASTGAPKTPVIAVTPAQKPGSSGSASKNSAAPAKAGASQKTPVVVVTPASKSAVGQKSAASKAGPFTPKTKPAVAAGAVSKPATPKKSVPPKTAVVKKPQPKVVAKPASGTATAKGAAPAKKVTAAGRRDPFVSPIRNITVGVTGPNCFTGKKCLYIPELLVQGTVKDNSTGEMTAVVVNRVHHTYFLRENDQVFNGTVEKITSDSVIFREYATDNMGRESAHEVVKRLGPHS